MQTQNHPLHKAVEQLRTMDKIDIHGKQYASVASRVEAFRANFPSATVETVLIHDDEHRVVMQAKISIDGALMATGYAEEFRSEGWINSSSAMENAETSAIGRSLASCGLSGSEHYASSNEVINAVTQQEQTQSANNNQHKNYNQQQNQSAKTDLSKHGIAIMQKGNVLVANAPDLYSKRAILKQNGYQFNPSTKEWWCYANQQKAA